jgi:type VI secretion system secreted protein Hcp
MAPPLNTAAGGSTSDIYLHLQSARAGKLKGEVRAAGHEGDIAVRSWHWGVSRGIHHSPAGLEVSSRTWSELIVVKSIDASSTRMMNEMKSNGTITEAVMVVRKAGGEALDYLTITLTDALISSIQQSVAADGLPTESVSFAFQKVKMEYVEQDEQGGRVNSIVFEDDMSYTA